MPEEVNKEGGPLAQSQNYTNNTQDKLNKKIQEKGWKWRICVCTERMLMVEHMLQAHYWIMH